MPQDGQQWEDHEHPAVTHGHGHYHVTHNFREITGGFEHLSSYHEHEHDHAGINHRHFPHENFEKEHEGEAHVHDHDAPVRTEADAPSTKKASARRTPAKKAQGT